MPGQQMLSKATNPYSRIPRQSGFNQSITQTIPAFGLVRVVGTNTNGSLVVDQPNADSQDVWVNGPIPIPPQTYGVISKTWPLPAAYNTGATPTIGQTWGAAAGSYLLTSGKTGLIIQSAPNNGRVMVASGYIASPPPPPGATLSVYSGSPLTLIDGAVTRIDGDVNTVLTFSEIAAGHAQCVFQAATVSLPGIVSTTTQTFAGNKTFHDDLFCANGIADSSVPQTFQLNSTGLTLFNSGNIQTAFASSYMTDYNPANSLNRCTISCAHSTTAPVISLLATDAGGSNLIPGIDIGGLSGWTGTIYYQIPTGMGGGTGQIIVTSGLITNVITGGG